MAVTGTLAILSGIVGLIGGAIGLVVGIVEGEEERQEGERNAWLAEEEAEWTREQTDKKAKRFQEDSEDFLREQLAYYGASGAVIDYGGAEKETEGTSAETTEEPETSVGRDILKTEEQISEDLQSIREQGEHDADWYDELAKDYRRKSSFGAGDVIGMVGSTLLTGAFDVSRLGFGKKT